MRTLLISLALLVVSGSTVATQTVPRLNGDVNMDGRICMDDSIQIIFHLWRDERSLDCPDAADLNRDGRIDVADVIGGLRHIFFGDPIQDCPISCPIDDGGYIDPYGY